MRKHMVLADVFLTLFPHLTSVPPSTSSLAPIQTTLSLPLLPSNQWKKSNLSDLLPLPNHNSPKTTIACRFTLLQAQDLATLALIQTHPSWNILPDAQLTSMKTAAQAT